MIVNLKVRDVTAHVHGGDRDHDYPVHVGHDGSRIVMLLDAERAEFLARLLANLSSDPDQPGAHWLHLVDEDTRTTWHHTMLDLLRSIRLATGMPLPVALTPAGVAQ